MNLASRFARSGLNRMKGPIGRRFGANKVATSPIMGMAPLSSVIGGSRNFCFQDLMTNTTSQIRHNTGLAAPSLTPIKKLVFGKVLLGWTIKACVISKSSVRHWKNERGEGKLFSVVLVDEDGDEISGTFFNDEVDRLYDVIEEKQTYHVSGGQVKFANKRFSSTTNDNELSFNRDTDFSLVEGAGIAAKVKYTFSSIDDCINLTSESMKANPSEPPNAQEFPIVDVIGIVRSFNPAIDITTRNGDTVTKRELLIVDEGRQDVLVTLWNQMAQTPDEQFTNYPVLALKGLKINVWNGFVQLGVLSQTIMEFNPHLPECEELQTWKEMNTDLFVDDEDMQ